jgi:hypothetical protein
MYAAMPANSLMKINSTNGQGNGIMKGNFFGVF